MRLLRNCLSLIIIIIVLIIAIWLIIQLGIIPTKLLDEARSFLNSRLPGFYIMILSYIT
jgi:Na+-driven multidrug efflux pump